MVFTNPLTATPIELTTVKDVYDLAYKVCESVIDGAAITAKYPELMRTVSEFGAILENVRVPATSSVTVNKDATNWPAPAYPQPSAVYFQNWTEKVFPAEVRRVDATKVLLGEMELDAFLANIVNANLEGYRNEVNTELKTAFGTQVPESELFETGALITTWNVGGQIHVVTDVNPATPEQKKLGALNQYKVLEAGATFEDVFTEMTRICKDMTFANSRYSGGFECGAEMRDLTIYAPLEFTAAAGVQFLSRLYQLSEAQQMPELRDTDGLVFTDGNKKFYGILIMDKRALSHVERWREAEAYPVPARKSMRFDLHVEEGIVYLPHYKAYMILFYMPEN